MDENYPLSELNNIPLSHNHKKLLKMAPFTPKSTSKLRSALHFRYSIVIPQFNPHNHYNHTFHNIFDYNHFIYSDYLLCTVTASAPIIHC